jgi:hypothetical protein
LSIESGIQRLYLLCYHPHALPLPVYQTPAYLDIYPAVRAVARGRARGRSRGAGAGPFARELQGLLARGGEPAELATARQH